ncbi:DinB family protein [Paenibacillus albus]|uniref:DinB family protein n=1 Tax=Paenibacillus albus TaxID=2495582 RepID=UPI001D131CED|nr:DinB family protein [Paenibacillus albus]
MNEKMNQFEDMIEAFLALKNYPESVLTDPISEGKWSIREIVGHLFYWDKLSLETMVPLMVHGATLPPFPNNDLHNEEGIS